MKKLVYLSNTFMLQVLVLAAMSCVAIAKETPTRQQITTHRICALDRVEELLPPPVRSKQSNSLLSYLAEEGFTQSQDGAWVCYVNDPKRPERYYTLLKVQEMNGQLVASSFLDGGNFIEGQEVRSIDFFMKLVERHTNTSQENRQSVRRYLETFVDLVKAGKIPASRRGFIFDQPNRALVLYQELSGDLRGTAITINIQAPSNLNVGSTTRTQPSVIDRLKLNR